MDKMPEFLSRILDSGSEFFNRAAARRLRERDALEARYLGKKSNFPLCCLLAYEEKYLIGPVEYASNLAKDKIIEESALRMRGITKEENFFTISYPALCALLKHPKCNLTHTQKINAVARWLRSYRNGRYQYVQQLVDEVLSPEQDLKIIHRISAHCAYAINSDVYKFHHLNWN